MMKSIEDTQAGGDFFDLLDKSDYNLQSFLDKLPVNGNSSVPQGTTVLVFHYEDGVIVAGDRRIMASSNLMFERCEKDAAVIAIKLLHVAAQIDNQQDNAISNVQIYPILASVTENDYKFWSEDQLARLESMSR
jgi:hypothetical protein